MTRFMKITLTFTDDLLPERTRVYEDARPLPSNIKLNNETEAWYGVLKALDGPEFKFPAGRRVSGVVREHPEPRDMILVCQECLLTSIKEPSVRMRSGSGDPLCNDCARKRGVSVSESPPSTTPRNIDGDPNFWESKDGRITAIGEMNPEHARNVIKSLHRQAAEAGFHTGFEQAQWCNQRYPQYLNLQARMKLQTKSRPRRSREQPTLL